jgi:hypothetical protein
MLRQQGILVGKRNPETEDVDEHIAGFENYLTSSDK